MIRIRKSEERGKAHHGWLDSKHTFSFGHYRDPEHMGFGALRVINEDKVEPGQGFGEHPHNNMEIISYVLEGALEHKDSLGTGSIIVPGDVQRMSAGTGITHSEFNPQPDKRVHFLQIWIIPNREGIPPSYEQKNFTERRAAGQLTLVASPDGRDDSLTVHQDAEMFVLDLDPGQAFSYPLKEGRMAWVQLARGAAHLNGEALNQGDGAAVSREAALEFTGKDKAEILIFDLASRISFN